MNPLKDAMTNEVFEMKCPTKSDGHLIRVLIRLYDKGVEVYFNRDDEIQTFDRVCTFLVGSFVGRVEEFIHAQVCD